MPVLDRKRNSRSRSALGWPLLSAVGLAAAAGANFAFGKWAEQRHPASGRSVWVDGVRLHYLDAGPRDGNHPPVVLLHGNGAMSDDWVISGAVDALAERHRVIVFDRPGFGHSTRPRARVWTPRAQAELLCDALDRIGVRSPIIVGHSLGALIALSMAMEWPERIKGLVLSSGYDFPTARTDVLLFSPPALPIIGDLIRYTIGPLLGWALTPPLIRKLFAPAPVPRSFAAFPIAMTLRPWQLRAVGGDSAAMVPAAAAASRRYRGVHVPAVVVAGDADEIVRAEQARALRKQLPCSELYIAHGVGHMLHHSDPDIIPAAVEAVEHGLRDNQQAAEPCDLTVAAALRTRRAMRSLWQSSGRPQGGLEAFRTEAASAIAASEGAYDNTVADSFPASDPPANSGITK